MRQPLGAVRSLAVTVHGVPVAGGSLQWWAVTGHVRLKTQQPPQQQQQPQKLQQPETQHLSDDNTGGRAANAGSSGPTAAGTGSGSPTAARYKTKERLHGAS